mmetsp:Transcript_1373/g.5566  ORF Transcript_1373/g.5566 Transcript_1373/m.5566 type:complete len:222 (+) Transcript_1373:1201-1866(+)
MVCEDGRRLATACPELLAPALPSGARRRRRGRRPRDAALADDLAAAVWRRLRAAGARLEVAGLPQRQQPWQAPPHGQRQQPESGAGARPGVHSLGGSPVGGRSGRRRAASAADGLHARDVADWRRARADGVRERRRVAAELRRRGAERQLHTGGLGLLGQRLELAPRCPRLGGGGRGRGRLPRGAVVDALRELAVAPPEARVAKLKRRRQIAGYPGQRRYQ